MARWTRYLFTTVFLGAGLGSCGIPDEPPAQNLKVRSHGSTAELLAAQGLQQVSVHKSDRPRFSWSASKVAAPVETAEAAARWHLKRLAGSYGVDASEIDTAVLIATHEIEGGTIVRLQQQAGSLAVIPSEVRVLVDRQFRLRVVSGDLVPVRVRADVPFARAPHEAVAAAVSGVSSEDLGADDIVSVQRNEEDFVGFELNKDNELFVPEGRWRKIVWAEGPQRPAYFVEFFISARSETDAVAYRMIVDATSLAILDRRDLTLNETPFSYRVWAEQTAPFRPLDGPYVDVTPHPTGIPDGLIPALVPSSLITTEGFNSNPTGMPDPWLPANATETVGNNVDAYSDDNDPTGFSAGDLRGTTTGPNTFDWMYDQTLEPDASETQTRAAIVELFYMTNWLHNYWYDSGFTEAAGNAQEDNYGRGGRGGDRMIAEAQDSFASGRRNNANMSTPSDGLTPRMQMYAWSSSIVRRVEVSSSATPLSANYATYGPTQFDVSGTVVLVDDSVGTGTDACEAVTSSVAGLIGLVDRGNCSFNLKARNLEAAGAIGMILANNRAGGGPRMNGAPPTPVTIGTLSITEADGDAIKAALLDGEVAGRLVRSQGVERSGSHAHGVVSHEWGHYLHNRLADCGIIQCRGMGEGWGDFLSLFTALRDGDSLDGAYPVGVWAQRNRFSQGAYFGIRRVPYSVDASFDALSFRHIADDEPLPDTHPLDPTSSNNSQVHNTGEIWASMLFEAYVAVLRTTEGPAATRTFDEVRRAFSEYIVAGLLLTPPQATFTEARDAILAGAGVGNPADALLMAEAFARRGSGTCAVSPPRSSETNSPVVESFAVQPDGFIGNVMFDDDIRSCDDDGFIDGLERGHVVVSIVNTGALDITAATLTVSSSATPSISFPAGDSVPVMVPAFETVEFAIEIALSDSITATAAATIAVQLTDSEACEAVQTSSVVVRLNVDEIHDSKTDRVDTVLTAWTAEGDDASLIWQRQGVTPLDQRWYATDYPSRSDTWLVSPALDVSGDLIMSFDHRYQFEAREEDASDTNYDGAVVETSTDAGATWLDVGRRWNPGYNGTLVAGTSSNPLSGRDAYVATSSAWPELERVRIDFGSAFAGETVLFRFRAGTDQSVGAFGWEFDNLTFEGIDNSPFYRVGVDTGICDATLIANAGPDQSIASGAAFAIDGSASQSDIGLPLTFNWRQTAGPAVLSSSVSMAQVMLTAPTSANGETLEFELLVADGESMATDSVVITVAATDAPVANAGDDQSVAIGSTVQLDGTASTGSSTLTFSWLQLSPSTGVELLNSDTAEPQFVAPQVDADTVFRFSLTVNDGVRSDDDEVEILVQAAISAPDAGTTTDAGVVQTDSGEQTTENLDEGGCGCATSKWPQDALPWAFMALLGFGLIRRRRP